MATITNQEGTLLGPLTTTWSAPEDCNRWLINCPTCRVAFLGQQCRAPAEDEENGIFEDARSCWPPTNSRILIPKPTPPLIGWGFYSPGLACPTGYKSACTAVYGQRPEWAIQFTLNPEETAVGCCPEGFFCTNINGNTCISLVSETATLTTATCDGTVPHPKLATITPIVVTDADGKTSEQTLNLLAPLYQLNFQSSDLIAASKPSSSETKVSSQPPHRTSSEESTLIRETNGSSSHTSAEESTGRGGLSVGAQAGIGVGVGVIGLILIVIGLCFFKRRRKQNPQTAYELFAQAGYGGSPKPTMNELAGRPVPVELA